MKQLILATSNVIYKEIYRQKFLNFSKVYLRPEYLFLSQV